MTGARGDWIPPPDTFLKTPTDEVSAFYHTLVLSYMSEIAGALQLSPEAAHYAERFKQNQNAYHQHFYNQKRFSRHLSSPLASPSRCCYGLGSQTSNIMALYIDAVPTTLVNETLNTLVASIYNHTFSPQESRRIQTDSKGNVNNPPAPLPKWGSGPHLDMVR